MLVENLREAWASTKGLRRQKFRLFSFSHKSATYFTRAAMMTAGCLSNKIDDAPVSKNETKNIIISDYRKKNLFLEFQNNNYNHFRGKIIFNSAHSFRGVTFILLILYFARNFLIFKILFYLLTKIQSFRDNHDRKEYIIQFCSSEFFFFHIGCPIIYLHLSQTYGWQIGACYTNTYILFGTRPVSLFVDKKTPA